jgi:CheY-like chemotaxis protein
MAKILIIEDDPYVRRFYDRLFHLNGYDAELAEGGLQGLAKAKELKPTLILLDIMMPTMDGFQVLEKLKSDPETKDIAVVMLTNLGSSESTKKAVQLGASGFIIKSDTPPEELLRMVDGFVPKQE